MFAILNYVYVDRQALFHRSLQVAEVEQSAQWVLISMEYATPEDPETMINC